MNFHSIIRGVERVQEIRIHPEANFVFYHN